MADYEGEVEIDTEPEDSNFAEEWRVGHLRGITVVLQPEGPPTLHNGIKSSTRDVGQK